MRSPHNAETRLAAPGEFAPLTIGPITVFPPVVLAPMAGVTNAPFRTLCRSFGGGIYVSEMITARGFVEGNPRTRLLASFAPEEKPRSIQLYGTDPASLAEATRVLAGEGRVDHVDLNFGCPVRKVTAQGGGAAIPIKPLLMARLVRAVVGSAGAVPVTVKVRMGIDDEHLSYLASGRVAQEEGCAAIGLHARTAAQLYDGEADWTAITALKASVGIPVLGNGDVWEAFDALRMMRETGCDGVIVGRGCLGRPWLFRELAEAFRGDEPGEPPRLGEVARIALRHAELLAAFAGERAALLQMRKLASWYTKAFPGAAAHRVAIQRVATLGELAAVLGALAADEPFPVAGLRARRGKHSGRQAKVHLPHGYLASLGDDALPGSGAEVGAESAEGG